jgi:lipopolysaccharide transport system ATP-binding protein
MNAIESLCQRVLHLDGGRLLADTTSIGSAITNYLAIDTKSDSATEWINPGTVLRNPWFYPTRFYLGDNQGQVLSDPVRNDEPAFVYIEGEIEELDIALNVGYGIFGEQGTLLFSSTHTDSAESAWPKLVKGFNRLRSKLPIRTLNQGDYRLDLLIAQYYRNWISQPGDSVPSITLSIQGGLSDSPYWMEKRPGLFAPVCPWTAETPNQAASPHNLANVLQK